MNNNWEKEYRERFGADYAEWASDETTDGAVEYIKSLLTKQRDTILSLIESKKKDPEEAIFNGMPMEMVIGYNDALDTLSTEIKEKIK